MKKQLLIVIVLLLASGLFATEELYLSGLNETTYIYRTAQDSLNSYFRDAFSFTLGYKDFTAGIKFLAELPKYSTDQSQLLAELNPNKLEVKWTERFLEYEKDNMILHGGTIAETFGSGMVFRAWEDLEFDTDTRLDGFLVKYDNRLKFKALYGALANSTQPTKYDLAYGADAEFPITEGINIGASALSMRTLNALNIYNQQDVFGGRLGWAFDESDGTVEYAQTSLYKNSGASREGTGLNANTNVYLNPAWVKTLTLGAGYKYYDKFQYRMQDLKTNNYHNETIADNLTTGFDEEGLQGILTMMISDDLVYNVNYAEAWNSSFNKRMNDLYTSFEWHLGKRMLFLEYGHIEKIDKTTDYWQKDIIPALTYSTPLMGKSLTAKAEYQYIEKVSHDQTKWHYEPMLQIDLGMGKLSLSSAVESHWQDTEDVSKGRYWVNAEAKYALFDHTDVTLFAGKEAGGKVCRNGVCRYVAPFQGIKLEAVTRF
jgi:hypothetical protein